MRDCMIKRVIFGVLLLLTMASGIALADIVSFEGGVIGDPTLDAKTYNYKEMVFISGKPIELIGTVVVPDIPLNKDTYSLTYAFDLRNKAESATVTRSVTYDVIKKIEDKYKQSTFEYSISKLDEQITIGAITYTLDGFAYNKSVLVDNTPAVDYKSGNIYLKRNYYVNGDIETNDGKVTITTTTTKDDRMIGYHHQWGNAVTVIMNQKIVNEKTNPDYDATKADSKKLITWSGNVVLKLSGVEQVRFEYLHTTPQNISFRGSYIQTGEKENVLQYTYDLPSVDGATVDDMKRNKGEENLRSDKFETSKSLITPKIRDIGGHWAEDDIVLLASLQVFDDNSEFFVPDLPITRLDFAKAISNAIAEIPERTQTEIIRSTRDADNTLFEDIPNTYNAYNYVQFVKDKGIMEGEFEFFLPDRILKRSEVIHIMVNILGLNHLAPAGDFTTLYTDDEDIQLWAKGSIYVANEINLVSGYEDGSIRPNNDVTRAEAATMIVRLINHIKDNIKIDYREKIINKY